MNRLITLGSAALLAVAVGMPAAAQMAKDSMSSDKMTMSKSDMAMMKKCQAMSSAMMAKNKKCTAMMKAHPDMMKDGMAKSDAMSK